MSMAAAEYVSVSSQADSEKADLARERGELADRPEEELAELTGIYVQRGLSRDLARQVAIEMHAKGALEAHARDELGITETLKARPLQAASASAVSFAAGAALPLLVVALAPAAGLLGWIFMTALFFLAVLGGMAARIGGANVRIGATRITLWGALAMAMTTAVGMLFGGAG